MWALYVVDGNRIEMRPGNTLADAGGVGKGGRGIPWVIERSATQRVKSYIGSLKNMNNHRFTWNLLGLNVDSGFKHPLTFFIILLSF